MMATQAVGGKHLKRAILAGDVRDALVILDIQLEVVRRAAIVLQRLMPVGLLVEAGHGDVADFEQFGRGEEDHVGRVVVEGIHHAAFFDQQGADAALLQLDSTGQAGRPRANYYDVERQARRPVPPRDRKSTRLNSSHLVISYAVFCLKKKK